MLPDLTLPESLLAVLENLRGVFTAPTFAAILTGLVAKSGKGGDRDAHRRGAGPVLVA